MLSTRHLFNCTIICCVLVYGVFLFANPVNPTPLVETEIGSISMDPASIKVFRDSISANIYVKYKEPSSGEATDSFWEATFTVPKRVLHCNKVVNWDSRRQYFGKAHDLSGYHYVEPASPLDRIMQALIAECQSRGRSVSTEPFPFYKRGFQFLRHTDNVMSFFDPASVNLSDGLLEFTILDFHYLSDLYNIHSVTVDTSHHQRRISPGKRHDGTGKIIGNVDGSEWTGYVPQSDFGKEVDIILEHYHSQYNQPAK